MKGSELERRLRVFARTVGSQASDTSVASLARVAAGDLAAAGLPLDHEPPTLPEVSAFLDSRRTGEGTSAHYIGRKIQQGDPVPMDYRGGKTLTADEAAFAARLLNALPKLREIACEGLESTRGTCNDQAAQQDRAFLRGRVTALLTILNDEEVKP